MAAWITTHHEECDGADCQHYDCASLPENVGQFREGEIVATKDDGSVEIEWTDATLCAWASDPEPRGTKRTPLNAELYDEIAEAQNR